MTEQEIVESITIERYLDGIEAAERVMMDEYEETLAADGDTELVSERLARLETSLTALRLARELVQAGDVSDEQLQDLATRLHQFSVASDETIDETAAQVEDVLDGEQLDSEAWSMPSP